MRMVCCFKIAIYVPSGLGEKIQMPARRYKTLENAGPGNWHREHRSKKGRREISSFHYTKTNQATKRKLEELKVADFEDDLKYLNL